MRQHSNLSGRQQWVETVSINEIDCATTAPYGMTSSRQLRTELQCEQFLNRLGGRLNQYVTDYLVADSAQKEIAVETEAKIFQMLVQELSQVLSGYQIAVLRSTKDGSTYGVDQADRGEMGSSEHSLQGSFVLSQLTSDIAPEKTPPSSWLLISGEPAKLEPGVFFTAEDIHYIQSQAPNNLWQIWVEPDLLGWLLIHSSSAAPISGRSDLCCADLQLIERSLCLCTQALCQIRLIQKNFQERQQLIACNQELAQTNQLKSEFLANTSHEIRTPLSSILGFTHLLKAQGFTSTNLRHQEYLNIILSSGQHLLALINDILDLSKIEANQLDLNWEIIDVPSVCQTALTLVKEKANDKGLMLELELSPTVNTLIADSLRLKQMLFNLLSNAIKFTLRGGVGVQVDRVNNFVHFTVWDTGIGISKEQQRLLFHPYSQIANPTVGHEQGTGLGLALTQKLAELHGGWVDVISEIDQGSRFTIALPLTPPSSNDRETMGGETIKETESRSKELASGPQPVRVRLPSPNAAQELLGKPLLPVNQAATRVMARSTYILLVEDNVHNAKLILTFLGKLGYEVDWVEDGIGMWQALERSLPALILMDIHLPVVDGLALIRKLKADQRYQMIPVIAQTAMAMTGDRDLCLEAGATNYISKPIDLDVLTELVSRYIKSQD